MPRITSTTYRANAGRGKMDIEPVEMSWTDIVQLLNENRRTFIQFSLDEFIGDDDGENVTPSAATIVKRIQEHALTDGLVVGQASGLRYNDNDELVTDNDGSPVEDDTAFRVTVRGHVSELDRIPKGLRKLAQGLKVDLDAFGAQADEEE